MIFLIFTAICVSFLPLYADNIYDSYGRYKEYFDYEGRFFDSCDSYKGKLIKENIMFTPYDKFIGKIDRNKRSMTLTENIRVGLVRMKNILILLEIKQDN